MFWNPPPVTVTVSWQMAPKGGVHAILCPRVCYCCAGESKIPWDRDIEIVTVTAVWQMAPRGDMRAILCPRVTVTVLWQMAPKGDMRAILCPRV